MASLRSVIVFPPSLCLPNTIYYALPVLAGALRDAGYPSRIVDLNLLAADRFLESRRTRRFLDLARTQVDLLRKSGQKAGASRMERAIDTAEPKVSRAPESKRILRDPVRFFDPPSFREAFWNVVDALAFFYQMDPLVSPHRPTFFEDLVDYQTRDPWTPLVELYEEDLLPEVLRDEPALVAISLAFPEQSLEAFRFARKVKAKSPGTHVCIGGPLLTQHSETFLRDGKILEWVDSVCIGDGEQTIVDVVRALDGRIGLDAVTNLVWRDGAQVIRRNTVPAKLASLSEAPLPEFGSLDTSLAFTPEPIWPLMLSRGCYWGRCTFCSIGWRENYRRGFEDEIRRDVRNLVRNHGARWVQIQDSSVPPRLASILAEIIRDERLEVTWTGGMKPESCFLEKKYCEDLYSGGCRSLLMGMESANQTILDRMDKGYAIDSLSLMLNNLRQSGISAEMLWFVGFPGETREQALNTVEWLYRHRDEFGLNAFVGEYLLHPDTIVYERPGDFGIIPDSIQNDTVHYRALVGMQPEELHRMEVMLGRMNNRTLVCNGSHLPHLAERGLDVSGIARASIVPPEFEAFCTRNPLELPSVSGNVTANGQQAFFDRDFGFRSRLESNFEVIRREWDSLPVDRRVRWIEDGAVDGDWFIVGLFAAGRRISKNCDLLKSTAAILDAIPGIYTAGFSVVGKRSRLPQHCGEDRTLLRCHLGIKIPTDSALSADGIVRFWQEGKTLVFDDTLPHFAWNDSESEKVILLIDFRNPDRAVTLDSCSEEQLVRDRAYYSAMFPEWHDQSG